MKIKDLIEQLQMHDDDGEVLNKDGNYITKVVKTAGGKNIIIE